MFKIKQTMFSDDTHTSQNYNTIEDSLNTVSENGKQCSGHVAPECFVHHAVDAFCVFQKKYS